METKDILKYKRKYDNWLCSECDIENSMSVNKCILCGHEKTPSDIVLNAWSEADEMPKSPPKKVTVKPDNEPVLKGYGKYDPPSDYSHSKESDIVKIFWGIIIAILIVCLFIAAIQGNPYAACLDTMDEFNNENHKTAIMLQPYKDVVQMENFNSVESFVCE